MVTWPGAPLRAGPLGPNLALASCVAKRQSCTLSGPPEPAVDSGPPGPLSGAWHRSCLRGAAVLGRCQNPGTLAPPLSPAGSPGMAAPRPLSRATPVSGPTCRSLGQGMLAGGAHFPPRTPHLLQRPRARAFLGCTPPRAFTQAPLAGWSVLPAEGPVTPKSRWG